MKKSIPKDFTFLLWLNVRKFFLKKINLLKNEFVFNILTFIITSIIVPLVFYLSNNEDIKNYFPHKIIFIVIALFFILILACFIFYVRYRVIQKNKEGFKKINEIMTKSFQEILSLFIEKMNLIKESTNKKQIISYLSELNEVSFFKQLTIAIYSSLVDMFNKGLEIKIDVFKHDIKTLNLVPMYNTYINGNFVSRKSNSLKVESEKISSNSLAEYSYLRNKIGCILDIPLNSKIYNTLTEKNQIKFIEKYKFYFKEDQTPQGFNLGSLFCFPLSFNGEKYGVLSIGFKEMHIEKLVNSIGISLEEFKDNIEFFISDYTKFTLNTSNGINNVLNFLKG